MPEFRQSDLVKVTHREFLINGYWRIRAVRNMNFSAKNKFEAPCLTGIHELCFTISVSFVRTMIVRAQLMTYCEKRRFFFQM